MILLQDNLRAEESKIVLHVHEAHIGYIYPILLYSLISYIGSCKPSFAELLH